MRKVLVTGSAGFIGSHLVKHYLDNGDDVWGIDCFASSNSSSEHHRKLLRNSRYKFYEIDINERHGYWFNERPKFDLILNFACPASPPIYQSMPIFTMMTCVLGTKNVLELAKQCGSVVVHASTSEVYGDPAVNPQPESYRGCVNSYGPRACYDEGKRSSEAISFDYLNMGVDARLVRIFNTYGPSMDPNDGRVVTNFVKQALNNEPITIYGNGMQTRSFCYVDDLVNGIVKLASLDKNPRTPINLGNPLEFTMNELADSVLATIPESRSIKVHEPLPIDDPTQRRPDITLANEILKWKPEVPLRDGLKKMVAYMRTAL